jgi:UDP-GlcNAc:undecaprenyl-phosphate GlcNAc-1-phosphate transferase
MREYVLVLLVTAAVTYLLTPLVRRVAVATRAIHAPRARDTHTEPTPLLGGLAMYGGLVAGLIVTRRLTALQDPFAAAGSKTAAGLLLAGALVVVVGFIDDRWGLSAISKLAGQVAAAGVLVWSGQSLPWLPMPSGGVFSLEPDLSLTLTILLVVVTINAINFIDGLDGLAAGIVAVAAVSFLVYSYTLGRTIGSTSESLPAVSSALLAGMCLGFLPHNFYPARIFMGDIGAMLLGLMLAYGPISSTASLDPALLINYSNQTLDRFPTFLPLLVPAAIFVIPYADLMFAVIRRAKAGKPLMAADRQHLHHRVLNIGHSYRQSVLIMYLWAALFSVTVVSLSVVRTRLVVFVVATAVAVLTLLPVTMPRLRPWRMRRGAATPPVARRTAAPAAANRVAVPAAHSATAPAGRGRPAPGARRRTRSSPLPAPGPVLNGTSPSGVSPVPEANGFPDVPPFAPQLPRAGRLPGADQADPFGPAYPADPLGPGPAVQGHLLHPDGSGSSDAFGPPDGFRDAFRSADGFRPPDAFGSADAFGSGDPFGVPAPGPGESPDPLAPPRRRDGRPW